MNLHRILFSLAVVVFAGGVIAGGTGAFFSDEETSSGNVFAAGSIDLTVDSEAHYNGMVCVNGEWQPEPGYTLVANQYPEAGDSCGGSWELTDLGPTNTFFDYEDLKPGDHGENTISLHVQENDAWACAIIDNLVDYENGCTEPEGRPEGTDVSCSGSVSTPDSGAGAGELSEELRFFAWADNGNNVWEENEPMLFSNEEGPASDVLGGKVYPLFTPGQNNGAVLPADTTQHIGLYWCYGDITVDANAHTLACNGSEVTNITQTDGLTADISFRVEQAQNNPSFTCSDTLASNRQVITLENADPTQDPWEVLGSDDIFGVLTWESAGATFDYTFTAQGLQENTSYSLIYYADPWPGTGGTVIGSAMTSATGSVAMAGAPDLGMNIPVATDANYPDGGKIWFIPSAYYDGTKVTGWPSDRSKWLFEGNELVTYDDTDIP